MKHIHKSHIFPDESDYTLCGKHKVDTGIIGQYSMDITEIKIHEDNYELICKICIKLWRKNKEQLNTS